MVVNMTMVTTVKAIALVVVVTMVVVDNMMAMVMAIVIMTAAHRIGKEVL